LRQNFSLEQIQNKEKYVIGKAKIFYGKVSVSKFEPGLGLRLGGNGLDYITELFYNLHYKNKINEYKIMLW